MEHQPATHHQLHVHAAKLHDIPQVEHAEVPVAQRTERAIQPRLRDHLR